MLTFRLQQLRMEVVAQHVLQRPRHGLAEIQRKVAETLCHCAGPLALRARELLLKLCIEVVLSCQRWRFVLGRLLQPVLVFMKKLVVKLIDVLQEEFMCVLLPASAKHGRGNGNLFPQLGRAERRRSCLGFLQLLEDVHRALEERAILTMRPPLWHGHKVGHELAQGADGLRHGIEVASVAKVLQAEDQGGSIAAVQGGLLKRVGRPALQHRCPGRSRANHRRAWTRGRLLSRSGLHPAIQCPHLGVKGILARSRCVLRKLVLRGHKLEATVVELLPFPWHLHRWNGRLRIGLWCRFRLLLLGRIYLLCD
mmetsp:Transcript_38964/g.72479  ORF Transcript_38964/g.72479 Transcript_38964/m.72479 type:complete len:310 (+) Transcript_38964:537-1466(+)